MNNSRRDFIKKTTISISALSLLPAASVLSFFKQKRDINVLVWDERQPEQREIYKNYMGDEIAEYLRNQPGLSVKSVGIDDPEQGLSDDILDDNDVLIWWGHIRQDEVEKDTGQKIVDRIKDGTLSMITLHSAHWSTPFMEAMNEITRQRAEQRFDADKITYVDPPDPYSTPEYDTRITPYHQIRKFPDGSKKVDTHLPYCCFPAYRDDGKPSFVHVTKPEHPIAESLPSQFQITHAEMYDEPFHVPEPDEVVIEERWPTGEWFRSGLVWELGQGRIFYFRPGHETYPVFKEEYPLKILDNAVRWMG